MTTTISSKGQVVIPQPVRDRHHLKAGDDLLLFELSNGDIVLRRARAPKKSLVWHLRRLRGPGPDRPFIGELRRAVSTTPNTGSAREMVLWDNSGLDAMVLGKELGFAVRNGELPVLGVSTSSAEQNGEGRKYAAAPKAQALLVFQPAQFLGRIHCRLAI